jgi:DNA-binding CsgD family transcriptional regulator
LTPRQEEVLELVREGLTNPEIAQRLGISPDGAKFHVSEIITKLGVTSRREAAEWDPQRDGATTTPSMNLAHRRLRRRRTARSSCRRHRVPA